MYTDGVAYAAIARNLSEGRGSFWSPSFSETINATFHSHPPLVFGLQSLVFTVLGDSLVAERLYAVLIFLATAGLMVWLWRRIPGPVQPFGLAFIPLTLWLLNEVVYHFYPANVLEPTAGLFALGSIYLAYRSIDSAQLGYGWAFAAGGVLCLAVLSKGPVTLFPLAFYFLYRCCFPARISWLSVAGGSTVLLLSTALPLSIIWFYPPAQTFADNYFATQLRASVLGENTQFHFRENRLYIVRRTFELLLPALAIVGLVLGVARYCLGKLVLSKDGARSSLLFILIGLSASVPLAVSPKQAYYYLLPSMPYFAIGLGLLIVRPVVTYLNGNPGRIEKVVLQLGFWGLTIFSIWNTHRHWGISTPRDREVLLDVEDMIVHLPRGLTIGGKGDLGASVSYLQRLREISIDSTESWQTYPYVVLPSEMIPTSNYEPLSDIYHKHRLWRAVSDE